MKLSKGHMLYFRTRLGSPILLWTLMERDAHLESATSFTSCICVYCTVLYEHLHGKTIECVLTVGIGLLLFASSIEKMYCCLCGHSIATKADTRSGH